MLPLLDKSTTIIQPLRYCQNQCHGCYLKPHKTERQGLKEVENTLATLDKEHIQLRISSTTVVLMLNSIKRVPSTQKVQDGKYELRKELRAKQFEVIDRLMTLTPTLYVMVHKDNDMIKELSERDDAGSIHLIVSESASPRSSFPSTFRSIQTALLWKSRSASESRIRTAVEQFDVTRILVPKNIGQPTPDDYDFMVRMQKDYPKLIIDPCFLHYVSSRLDQSGQMNFDNPRQSGCNVLYIEAGEIDSCHYHAKDAGVCHGMDSPQTRKLIRLNRVLEQRNAE